MKKKIVLLALAVSLLFGCSACGDKAPVADAPSNNVQANAEKSKPTDLTGEWRTADSKNEESYQSAVITGNTITVYWVSDGGDTKSLYWAGSYIAPDKKVKEYSWDSVNDKEQTDSALLASGDETKTFTFKNNQICYEVSALGTTKTEKLERMN